MGKVECVTFTWLGVSECDLFWLVVGSVGVGECGWVLESTQFTTAQFQFYVLREKY